MRSSANKLDAAMIICGMWCLWTSRNNIRHGSEVLKPSRAIRWAREVTEEACSLMQTSPPNAE